MPRYAGPRCRQEDRNYKHKIYQEVTQVTVTTKHNNKTHKNNKLTQDEHATYKQRNHETTQ